MEALLRWAGIAACALVLIGFAAFAAEEADRGSKGQVAKVDGASSAPAPTERGERAREKRHGSLREAVDDANDVLLSPFSEVTGSSNVWVRRLVPTALALLVYGLGLLMLANYLPKRRRPGTDWRAPQPH